MSTKHKMQYRKRDDVLLCDPTQHRVWKNIDEWRVHGVSYLRKHQPTPDSQLGRPDDQQTPDNVLHR